MNERLATLRQEVEQALIFDQPSLVVSIAGNQVVVAGDYFLNDLGSGPDPEGPIAIFKVRVEFDDRFPELEPNVFETGGAVPAGRHLNPNGTCCLGVWEQWLVQAPEKSPSAFFSGPLRDYFLSQAHYQAHQEWPFGELSHGLDGIVEAYASVLGIAPHFPSVVDYLRVFSRPGWPRGHWECPCGSGRRIRTCHKTELTALRDLIPPTMADRMLSRMACASM